MNKMKNRPDHIGCHGLHFCDATGRERLFYGINLCCKGVLMPDGGCDHSFPWDDAVWQRLHQAGCDLVRLGFTWDSLEPEPGVYSLDRLAAIRRQLDLAAAAGIHVILDMHQDLYAQRFSDGAPDWAVLTDAPYEPGRVWSDAYLTSTAVQEAWDAFWENRRPAGGSQGLQDSFAAVWSLLARGLGGHEALFAYDILNEPTPGRELRQQFASLLSGFASLLSEHEKQTFGLRGELTQADLAAVFFAPERRLAALDVLTEAGRYRRLGDAAAPLVADWDARVLAPFYTRVATAIRAHDRETILLRAHSYLANMGVPSGATPILLGDGSRDPRQAYTAHGYDLVVDTEALDQADSRRTAVIFERHRETQLELQMPLIVGEWGAFGHSSAVLAHGADLLAGFARHHWSQTYWCHEHGFGRLPVAELLKRPHPAAVPGRLRVWESDAGGSCLRLEWEPSGQEESWNRRLRLYCHRPPLEAKLDAVDVLADFAAVAPEGGWLELETGDAGRLELHFPAHGL
ncbi:MAG: cellulase family glycosylhydrolase [Bacillota bacterium]|nr:cellulase family glycosylhydrolase [Bacillota bacterium]